MTRRHDATQDDGAQPTVIGPPSGLGPGVVERDEIQDGTILGRYVVLERLGSGAMGIVLRAYDPKLHREVALKLLRPGIGPEGTLGEARLLREAQALARLNHPHVVAVYDVDKTDRGVVISMEYVEGRTLRSWLKERPRAWSEVLAVMLAAARGLASAHAAELVHRDVKPDNILVGAGEADGPHSTGRVRVTDFGLARARTIYAPSEDGYRLSDDAQTVDDVLTQAGTVVGTPGYMAPEQHAGATADAQADQYSLCITMWEALYGARPFSGRDLKELAAAKLRGPPAVPSGSVPRWLHAVLARGLAVRPEDRWPSVEALADALASGSTRARRRRVLFGLTGVAVTTLGWVGMDELERVRGIEACEEVGAAIFHTAWSDEAQARLEAGIVGTQLSFAATTHERARSWIEPYARTWQRLRTETCVAAEVDGRWDADLYARAQQCFDERLDHLAALLDVLAEGERDSVPRAVAAVAVLPHVEVCIDAPALARRPRLPHEPERRARADAIHRKLLRARGLGATGRHAEGLALGREVVEDAAGEQLLSQELEAELATGVLAEGAGQYEEAETRLRRALVEGGGHGFDELAADAALTLVHVVGLSLARHGEGLAHADTATILVRRIDPEEDSPRHMRLFTNLANLHAERSETEEAERLHERALAVAEAVYGPDHPALSVSLNNLVNIHARRGDHAMAEELATRALTISETALGPDHPDVAFSLTNVALIYDARGLYDDAEPLFRRALAIREAALGPNHPYVARSLTNIGIIVDSRHEHDDALALFERALAIRETVFGSEHPELAFSLTNIGIIHDRRGEYDQAQASFERALAIREAAYGLDHPLVAVSLSNLALVEKGRGEYEAAQRLLERALAIREARLGPEDPIVAYTLTLLAGVLSDRGESDEPLDLLVRALEVNEGAPEPRSRDIAYTLEYLADHHLDRGAPDEAEPLYRRALELRQARTGFDHHAAYPLVGLARVAMARGRPQQAIEPLERAASIENRYTAPELRADAGLLLARALWDSGRDRERPIELARRARHDYRRAGAAGRKGLVDAERWLDQHAVGR